MPITTKSKKRSLFEGMEVKEVYQSPEVTFRKVKNGYIATKRGGEIDMEANDYRGVEIVFTDDDADKAIKSCLEFLKTGKTGDYKE